MLKLSTLSFSARATISLFCLGGSDGYPLGILFPDITRYTLCLILGVPAKAYGFPETAIEVFVGKREKLDISKLPKEIRESDVMLFSSPTLSKDNWQEEIKQGQLYANFIKKVSLVVYEEMRVIALRRVSEIDSKENL